MANLNDSGRADDISRLRRSFPGWFFTSIWAAAGTGPDKRLLVAQRHGVVLADFTAAALAAKIKAEG